MQRFDVSTLRIPVVQAPMAGGPSTPALAAAVSNAGGLGSLATGYLNADAAERQLEEFRALSSGPVAVNVFVPEEHPTDPADAQAYRDALLTWAEDSQVPGDIPSVPVATDDEYESILTMLVRTTPDIVTFTFGLPSAETVARLQSAGIAVGVTVTAPAEAWSAVDVRADLVIAQGIEAGGHRAQFDQSAEPLEISSGDIVRTLAADLPLPVIAAGGVDSDRAAQELLDGGAVAVQVGTLFLTADESGTKPTHRAAVLDAGARTTVLTRVFTGRPARALANRFTAEMEVAAVVGYPEVHVLTGGIRAAAAAADDPEHLHLWAGTGVASCLEVPASEILQRFDGLRRPAAGNAA